MGKRPQYQPQEFQYPQELHLIPTGFESKPAAYLSNHILVNRERMAAGLPKLKRSPILDALAAEIVQQIAATRKLRSWRQTGQELRDLLGSKSVGQNLCRGTDMVDMHSKTMADTNGLARKNLFANKFKEFGMATARGQNGKLYMVQFFRGETCQVED